jgi:ATP-dependent helicase/nuclease subunit A
MGLFGKRSALDIAREETRRNQAAAADPGSSAWVSANAGTGKTHVLSMRILRLLLAGTPERILALHLYQGGRSRDVEGCSSAWPNG